ncbi:MAG: hypothetical protein IJ111_04965 [Eggerthellaceae bacterium]|nr:hypothetical protein [Eggerthellaceae bacterium]
MTNCRTIGPDPRIGALDPCDVTIPAGQALWFRRRIDEMSSVFADEERSDWFDADDMAREIAEELGRILPECSDVRDPSRCPQCGSAFIEGGHADFDRRQVYQRLRCCECGFQWSDAYEYANYLPLG